MTILRVVTPLVHAFLTFHWMFVILILLGEISLQDIFKIRSTDVS